MSLGIDRRGLMKRFGAAAGLSGAAYFLPTLRRARAATPPRRFLMFYSHQATLPWLWVPRSGGRTDFVLGDLLSPLQAYRQDLVLLSGVDFKALQLPGGSKGQDGHASGQACSLTANVQLNDPSQGTPASQQSRGTGPSFEYWLSRELESANRGASPTPFKEQRWRILERPASNPNWGRPFQDHNNAWQLAELSPHKAFNTLFGGMMPGAGAPDAAIPRRKSALDFAAGEFAAVANRVGVEEKRRLDNHATLVRELERSLVAQADARCARAPAEPPFNYTVDGGRWNHTMTHFPKLMQAAFACDLTRVIALQVEEPPPAVYGGLNPAQLGGIDNLHDLVHAINVSSRENQDAGRLRVAKAYYAAVTDTFKTIVDALATLRESDGSRLLDNTIVLWCGELAQPGHSTGNCKWLFAGGRNAGLRTGQYFNWDGDAVRWDASPSRPSNGDVFTTVAHALGVRKNFGNPATTRGPISDALA